MTTAPPSIEVDLVPPTINLRFMVALMTSFLIVSCLSHSSTLMRGLQITKSLTSSGFIEALVVDNQTAPPVVSTVNENGIESVDVPATHYDDEDLSFVPSINYKERPQCIVKFVDNKMLLCHHREDTVTPVLEAVTNLLESRFPGCSAAHIGIKDLSSYPELRFDRRCFYAMNTPPLASIRSGDHFWGPQNAAVEASQNLTTYGFNATSSRIPYETANLDKSFPFHLFDTMKSGNSTVVILIGNLRGGEKTWGTLYKHVLDINAADMVIFHVGEVPAAQRNSTMMGRAKFVSEVPFFADWADAIDIMAKGDLSWRTRVPKVLTNDSIIIGGALGIEGSGALILSARWFLTFFIREYRLRELYDRFVISRPDHYYNCAHDLSVLEPSSIWVPNGQDWHGIVDRHVVVNSTHVLQALNVLPPLIRNPESFQRYKRNTLFHKLKNTETFLKLRWEMQGLWPYVQRYRRMMFVAAVDGDKSLWREVSTDEVPEGVLVKYKAEYSLSKSVCLNTMLDGNLTIPSEYKQPPKGNIMKANRVNVQGWACDLDDPFNAINVRLVFSTNRNQIFVTEISANGQGSDNLRLWCWGGSDHRFVYPLNFTEMGFGDYAKTSRIVVRGYAIDRADPSIVSEIGRKRIK
jgi:hypothetical protein